MVNAKHTLTTKQENELIVQSWSSSKEYWYYDEKENDKK